ncbi:BREX-5 system adenine-specific DNA-methyltransferase PglX [Salinibacter ruber]|uniref:BREX-5 system adenine-specific DNA-methyltransferase PglX n=1 Tax=Salinibacter ruber TaxID=146919 RepID=UPI0020732046|nr:BREX-5 system adenine-specific DNA-methyltransferase PglX [Salinibacter ruber]
MTEVTQQAQLDEPERRHLEKIVKQLRERAEETVEYWVHSKLNLAEEAAEAPTNLSTEERELRGRVEEAIEREQAGGQSWSEARDLYVKGVSYTLVNRLAALRCMEVRGFLDRSPTRFRDDGVTPAADRLITDYFLPREAGIWTAFLVACQERSEEIEILFDLSDPYSLLYGDLTDWDGEPEELAWSDDLQASLVDLLQDLGSLLDEVEDEIWRADDVLGWMYEYYNAPELPNLRQKARNGELTPDDVPGANQFYTQHWVVRMLADNSIGKLFLEHEGELQETIRSQEMRFKPEERKNRSATDASSVEELCTYLVATEGKVEATEFDHPKEIKVFDPASGSAHFLLYAFDILERIWWAMAPEVSRAEVPEKILKYNLYGIDLDLRACQLAAFSLYLKARSRAELQGGQNFEMPNLGIVCADAHVADLDTSHAVFDEVAGENEQVRETLNNILKSFKQVEGLGSLLDVKGALAELIEENGHQLDAFDDEDMVTLPILLSRLHRAVTERVTSNSFRAKDLRSFLKALVLLSQDYDVALMNPPYGARYRMPDSIKEYVRDTYEYGPEYYINFHEACDKLLKENGRIGMLVPRSFMIKRSFEDFRKRFVEGKSSVDLLAEYGLGILDKATVRTAGVVTRKTNQVSESPSGLFFRLHDVEAGKKEATFLDSAFSGDSSDAVQRRFTHQMSEFGLIPGSPLFYWVPQNLRALYDSETVINARNAKVDRKSFSAAAVGIETGKDDRFLRNFWELSTDENEWVPFAKGGEDTWAIPRVNLSIIWTEDGKEVRRYDGGNGTPNERHYFKGGITYNAVKTGGKRFGLLHSWSIFSHKGPVLIPDHDRWQALAYLNSTLATYLVFCQTPERMWEMGEVAKLPWLKELTGHEELEHLSKHIAQLRLSQRTYDLTSPFYSAPLLLQAVDCDPGRLLHQNHPHRDLVDEVGTKEPKTYGPDAPLDTLALEAESFRKSLEYELNTTDLRVDQELYGLFGIGEGQQDLMHREIELRTGTSKAKTSEDGDITPELPDDYPTLVKRLLLHVVFQIVEEDDDGIVLLRAESDEEEADLLAKMRAKFEDIWGEYAEDRLQEVDEVLGNREPTAEPYPNLRHWLENDLFGFHCGEFENTPILWELTTERLGEDNGADAGFACLIDYHQLGPDVFDRLSARYLETRKAALRERQQSARRTAEGSEGTQAREARQEEKRCESALRQIDELETRISELTQSQPRDWADAVRDEARDLQPKVRRFRERLEERLETLDALHEEAPSAWFKDHFSDKFMESVGSNREEWIDALEDLEAACEQFARPADQPVEAHLYDLLPYFDDLTGSTHYSSNGIFFLNYYFSKGKDLAAKIDQGNKDRVTRREQLVADLARETDDDIELGKEINEACQAMKKHMDSDWTPRALEEVRTPGYRPVKKHGVAINITPLAEKKLVPELVDKKVL